jgi:hypothetical protein
LKGTRNIQQERTDTAKGRLLTRMNTRLTDRRADGKQTLPTAQKKMTRMDRENSCVTGNKLTDYTDADYYYLINHTCQHVRAEKPSPVPDYRWL